MLKPYLHLMRRPGAGAFFVAGILGRMPISMIGLGIVILIARESGSYGLAGAVSGVAVVAGALTGPIQGRLVDRFGQRMLLLVGTVLCTIGLAGLLVAVRADAPTWVLYALSFVAGGTRPQVGSFVRARWTHLLGRGRALQTAFALEAVGDEVVFIIGPVAGHRPRDRDQPVRRARRRPAYSAWPVASWLALLRGSDPPGRGKAERQGDRPRLPWLSIAAAQPDRAGARRDPR